MNKSLYIITKEAREIASLLEEGEYTPEMETALLINQSELQAKGIDYAYVIKGFKDTVSAIEQEIKRLQAEKSKMEKAIDWTTDRISNSMQICGVEKISSPTLTISFRKSESIEIDNFEQLQERFLTRKVSVSPDKIRIKQAIKDGENVEGARLSINFNLQIK